MKTDRCAYKLQNFSPVQIEKKDLGDCDYPPLA